MIEFPWTFTTAPNFLLDINAACNIQCRGCYKLKGSSAKSLAEIERDLDAGLKLRRAQTVSIAGAEPTLHPRLPEVVRMVRRRGLRAALLTNGLLLKGALLAQLKAAGLDVAMVHVDEGQQRSDLPSSPTLEQVNALRREIAVRVAAHGIDVGLCATIYPQTLENVPALVRLLIESEAIGFLFVSHYVDVQALATNPRQQPPPATDNRQVVALLHQAFGIQPFAQAAKAHPLHWISYFVPVSYRPGRAPRVIKLQGGRLDSFLVSLPRYLSGRNLFYTRNSPAITLGHVLLNRAASGDVRELARVLGDVFQDGRLGGKRMIFDNGLRLTPEGKLDCLEFCPNATVRNGVLVPICLSDYAEQLKMVPA